MAGPGNEITHIAWNRKVQHILASTIANGTTVVWDLKRQKPVISFKDPNRQGLRRQGLFSQGDISRWRSVNAVVKSGRALAVQAGRYGAHRTFIPQYS